MKRRGKKNWPEREVNGDAALPSRPRAGVSIPHQRPTSGGNGLIPSLCLVAGWQAAPPRVGPGARWLSVRLRLTTRELAAGGHLLPMLPTAVLEGLDGAFPCLPNCSRELNPA